MKGDAKWWEAKNRAVAIELRAITEFVQNSKLPEGALVIPTGSYTIANNGVKVEINWDRVMTAEEVLTTGSHHVSGTWDGCK